VVGRGADAMKAKSFAVSVQGASHIKRNKECQDSSIESNYDDMAIAVVCDGHGGDDYVRSGTGSRLACEVAERNIRTFVNMVKTEELEARPHEILKRLEASIISDWRDAIEADFAEKPFEEEELAVVSEKARARYTEKDAGKRRIESAYGTTLIAVVMTRDYCFGIQIGDGKCVALDREGRFGQPIPPDERCFLNATTSICDSDALDSFRQCYFPKAQLPAAIFAGSDGVDDCFRNDGQLYNLYKTVVYSFGTTDYDEAAEGLKDYLPRLSAKGSGDDVSIAAIFDMDVISGLDIVREFDREKEKERVEAAARKEAMQAAPETDGEEFREKDGQEPAGQKLHRAEDAEPSGQKCREEDGQGPVGQKLHRVDEAEPSGQKCREEDGQEPAGQKLHRAEDAEPSGQKRREEDGQEPAGQKLHRVEDAEPSGQKRREEDGQEPAGQKLHRVDGVELPRWMRCEEDDAEPLGQEQRKADDVELPGGKYCEEDDAESEKWKAFIEDIEGLLLPEKRKGSGEE